MSDQSSPRRSGRSSRNRARLIIIISTLLVVLVAGGYAGFQGFMTWRARDLAAKALDNFDGANYRMAWIQINSARTLRGEDVSVLRNAAIIEEGLGLKSSVGLWDTVAAAGPLSGDDLEKRARATARFGTEEQFEAAVTALEGAGDADAAGRLRSGRRLLRGDMDRAIEEARRLAEARADTAMQFDVAKLLFQRHVDRLSNPANPRFNEVTGQITAIIDPLMGTPQEPEALAFALTFLRPPAEKRIEWSDRAMQNLSATNVALLPAAAVMVELGKSTPADLHRRLRPVFDAAPLDRRAAFALWLTRQDLPREALTLITAQEAAESADTFNARIEALARTENWNGVLETAAINGRAPESARLAAKARAEYALGRGEQSGAKSVADALRAATRDGGFSSLIVQFDAIGATGAVDEVLIELCGDPRVADSAFRAARDRFSRRGPAGETLLVTAHDRAKAAAPNEAAVIGYDRYKLLLADIEKNGLRTAGATAPGVVDPQETAKSVQETPADEAVRATHALALIQAGRGAESFAVFDDITIYFNRLPPPMQAVLAAAAASSGQPEVAAEMRRKTPSTALLPAEATLLESGAFLSAPPAAAAP